MSGRGIWIVALGAALTALVALEFFRSEERRSDEGREVASGAASAGADEQAEQGLAADGAAEEARASGLAELRADAPAADGRDAPTELQRVAGRPPSAVPYASISAALEQHDVPPERRMLPVPEMLVTERAFAAESADPGWSTAAEARVLAGFAAIPGLSLVSLHVECRATLCLLQFVEPQTPAPNQPNPNVDEIVQSAGLKVLWRIGIRAAGAPVSMAYLAREPAGAAPADAPRRP
jgi:hypothetical protein